LHVVSSFALLENTGKVYGETESFPCVRYLKILDTGLILKNYYNES